METSKGEAKVYINRTLNLKKIRYIGFDMDHTLVRYKTSAFEELTYRVLIEKLVQQKGYPPSLLELRPQFDLAIRGLIIDRIKGNLLKVNRYGWIRKSAHGTQLIDYPSQLKIYKSVYIDLSETEKYYAVDTAFAIPTVSLFAQLVDQKDGSLSHRLPDYETIFNDLQSVEDEAHNDESLKGIVAQDLEKFIIRDEGVVQGLEKYIKHEKKLFVVTNSEYNYTKLLLDYAINPFLKDHSSWHQLFEFVITGAQKPRFFYEKQSFLHIDPTDLSKVNCSGKITPGIYQRGNALQFATDLSLDGQDILFIGDHIYSDIIRLKKSSSWRTALVLDDLKEEISSMKKAEPYANEIHQLMKEKEPLEHELVGMISLKIETGQESDDERVAVLGRQIHDLDTQIGLLIQKSESLFNPRWGEIMRAGNEESFLAYLTDRFACIYMTKLKDMLDQSPRTYFRASRRPLPHEI